MKTKGVEVWDGYLAAGFRRADGTWTPTHNLVPDALWGRLKQQIAKAARVDEFKADESRFRETLTGFDVEIALFRAWVAKLGLEIPAGHYPGDRLWPWSRGWTEERVDSYLMPVSAKAAA